MPDHSKEIAILYHGGCPDGFGGAYAAWKKFGDAAEYIPVKYQRPVPEGLAGRTLYFIDFCYPQEVMDNVRASAKSVTVLDHHLGTKAVVESIPEHVFDANRSGAVIAWEYFHPDTPVPILLQYVQEGDLYRFALPDSRAVLSYSYLQPFHFDSWQALEAELEDETRRTSIIERGRIYSEQFGRLVEQIANKASLVLFEGVECYMVGAADMFASDIGNLLAEKKPPLAIVAVMHGDSINISLRSTADFDVSVLARKYGGNGHPRASGFKLKWGDPLPWTVIKEHENPRY